MSPLDSGASADDSNIPDAIQKQHEDAIALAFAREYRDSLKFCHHSGKWHKWNGVIWELEETQLAFHWARELCRRVNVEESKTLGRAKTAAAVEQFARADRPFAVTSSAWDRDPFLLGTPGGTVDLKTGTLRPSLRTDMITKSTSVTPQKEAGHPMWSKFLAEATNNDKELQKFLQQIVGYCLTGDTREQCLFFVHGDGGNGKGVFLNTITAILGDYHKRSTMEAFTASKAERHSTDIAMLKGARMVSASETEQGRAWAEAKINQLTGGDEVTARFMRKDNFTFRPTFKLFIIGNHKPDIRNVNDAARRRFNIIPFNHKPEEKNLQLEHELRREHPAILQWMIEGCIDWQESGLRRPQVVVESTEQYFKEQDVLKQWIDEFCEVGKGKTETRKYLFSSWSKFATSTGEDPRTQKWFLSAIRRHVPHYKLTAHTPGDHSARGVEGIHVIRWSSRNAAQKDDIDDEEG